MYEGISEAGEGVPPEPDDYLREVLESDLGELSAAGSLKFARDVARLRSALEARRLAAIHRYEESRAEEEWSPDLLASETKVSIARANREVSLACTLRDRLPHTWAALRTGDLDRARVDQIEHATAVLDDAKARPVGKWLFPKVLGLNPRQPADFARLLVARIDPDGAAERARIRREEGRLRIEPVSDRMAWMNILGGIERVLACKDRVDRIVNALPADDPRTWDQQVADTILDLIEGTTTSDTQAHIYVTVDVKTLLGLNNFPGNLRGYGPLPADIGREPAYSLKTEWAGVLADQDGRKRNGHQKIPIPRPTRRIIRLRDQKCDFPDCNRSARYTDVDHT
ncbi:MAG TPA: DUF222 domain-containing protein [Amycolatopsis sp.]|uniref:DUF222 domain-containing protein n=1 Tax=Amycolatopsis sp. TaxID=37632 RepID=UPI002B477852|nr:DUF222 domain-containing protein [Amycolatopsis sp.]HKS48883.1 DUF222 domain-containing protein [Amycolatopsis sp.]